MKEVLFWNLWLIFVLALSGADCLFRRLPRRLILFLFFAGLFSPFCPLESRLFGMALPAAVLFLCCAFRPGSFGGGDIRFLAAAGFVTGGRTALLGFSLSVFLGVLLALLVRTKKAGLKKTEGTIPFGPCIAAGYTIALLIGG